MPCPLALSAVSEGANMLGYFVDHPPRANGRSCASGLCSSPRLHGVRPFGPSPRALHVVILLALTEEGSLEGLPPSAARACPRVLLAVTAQRVLPFLETPTCPERNRGISRFAPLVFISCPDPCPHRTSRPPAWPPSVSAAKIPARR